LWDYPGEGIRYAMKRETPGAGKEGRSKDHEWTKQGRGKSAKRQAPKQRREFS
jgi:hypothetical protein